MISNNLVGQSAGNTGKKKTGKSGPNLISVVLIVFAFLVLTVSILMHWDIVPSEPSAHEGKEVLESSEDTQQTEASSSEESASQTEQTEQTQQTQTQETSATEEETTNQAEETTDPKPTESVNDNPLALLNVGDTFYFGKYEQDNDLSNGYEDILWIVLEKEDDKILAITLFGLDTVPYHTSDTNITWEQCSLRTWLNSGFFYSAFSQEEQASILTTTVQTDYNPAYGTNSGPATKDKVFILSLNQVLQYMPSNSSRLCCPTSYARAQGSFVSGGYGWWVTLTPGNHLNNVVSTNTDGSIDSNGGTVISLFGMVRPAIWISVEP